MNTLEEIERRLTVFIGPSSRKMADVFANYRDAYRPISLDLRAAGFNGSASSFLRSREKFNVKYPMPGNFALAYISVRATVFKAAPQNSLPSYQQVSGPFGSTPVESKRDDGPETTGANAVPIGGPPPVIPRDAPRNVRPKLSHEVNNNGGLYGTQTAVAPTPTVKTSVEIFTVMTETEPLLKILPEHIRSWVVSNTLKTSLNDIILDAYRPLALYNGIGVVRSKTVKVSLEDLSAIASACGPINSSQRACIGHSLHRASFIKDGVIMPPNNPSNADAYGELLFNNEYVVGATLRLARDVEGPARVLMSLVPEGASILLVGPPGSGKTTLLRDLARTLSSDEHGRRTMVVDTTNEIAGEGTLPNSAIGNARRIKVHDRERQFKTMLEAVQNHTPDTLVIDEIGTRLEVTKAISIQRRGVQLVATTHGLSLEDIIANPDLRELLGGVSSVILSAGETRDRQRSHKTSLERRMEPVFGVAVEILSRDRWRVYANVSKAADAALSGGVASCQLVEFEHLSDPKGGFDDKDTHEEIEVRVKITNQHHKLDGLDPDTLH